MKATLLKNSIAMLFIVTIMTITLKVSGQHYKSWDGGSGPTKNFWSVKLELPWVNPVTGDWMDAKQTPQGTIPYTSTTVSATGRVNFKVDTLVARWLTNGLNRGFYLQSKMINTTIFDGRTCSTVANRPKLTIKTEKGTFNPPCSANANWSTASAVYDTRDKFSVSRDSWFAIVQFDLSGVQGTKVTSAILTLNCTLLKTAGVINIMEANPPAYKDGGDGKIPIMGIAQKYPLDKNINQDANVVFAADFSDLSKSVWNSGGPSGNYSQVYDPVTQSTYYRGDFPVGSLSSCSYERNVIRGKADGTPDKVETELYARYYVYLEKNWGSTVDANKMPGFDLRMGWWNPAQGGYWQATTGNGGSPGTGLKKWKNNRWEYQGCSERGHGGKKFGDGNPYDDLFWVGGYMYHLDQVGPFGEGIKWNGTVLSKEKWYCIEHYIKVNSISGPYDTLGNGTANFDGVYKVWVDGVLTYERNNFRWRRHPEMGIQGFWLNWYHGGVDPVEVNMNYRMNAVVIARKYIGPRRGINTRIDELVANENSFHIYPNPAQNEVNIKFEMPEAANLTIKLFNVLGQEAESIAEQENYPAGEHIVHLNTGNLSNGLYFIKLIDDNNKIQNGKIVIER
ncbi:MAG: T9SS type A sorting domain-containing protein [Bacteroidetes bacterium]|nr:T9SS type A sorting domain-containing protein [Bacteroidota bacterium]